MKNLISQGLRLGQKVSKGLRAAYETVTGRLRDDKPRNMSGSRVAREWLKYAAIFAMLFSIGIGNVWGADQTWNLTTNSYASISSDAVTWSSSYVTATATKGTGTQVNNYCPPSYSQHRLYNNNTLTITPVSGYSISSIKITATGASYRIAGTWTNGTASAPSAQTYTTITPADGTKAVSCAISATCRLTEIKVTYESLSKCSTPSFSVTGGTYTTSKSVTLSCATDGATIRYTTDGTDPTESSSAYSSAITVDASKTIKAKAFKDGLDASDVASATYTIKCATPTFSEEGGTKNNDVNVTLSTSFGTSIYYTTDGSTPTTSSTLYSSAITVNATQTIKAIAVKSGCSNSDVASATYTMICATPSLSKTTSTNYNDFSVTITTATTDGVIRYTLDGTDPTESSAVYSSEIAISSTKTLKAKVFKTGYTASSVASANYTMQCYQPTFSDAAGRYYSDKSVTMSTDTKGATIYYTTDNTAPTTLSAVYSDAIDISRTTTLKAIAVKSGYTNSSTKSATFTIQCVTPTATPAAGTYTGSADITLSTTYGDAIYYTTSTTSSAAPTPTTESTLYTGPIHITTTTKIKAIATKEGCENSTILGGSSTYLYTIQYNVTWMVDGAEWTPSSSGGTDGQAMVNSGTHISTLPTDPTTGEFCGDRFMGWTDAPNGEYVYGSSGLYTTASEFPNATGDQVFYAVFADYAE